MGELKRRAYSRHVIPNFKLTNKKENNIE